MENVQLREKLKAWCSLRGFSSFSEDQEEGFEEEKRQRRRRIAIWDPEKDRNITCIYGNLCVPRGGASLTVETSSQRCG